MERRQHRAVLAVPLTGERDQVRDRPIVDGVERFVKPRSAANPGATGGQTARAAFALPVFESGEPDCCNRPVNPLAFHLADGAEGADASPQPHRDKIIDVDWKRTVDLAHLGQISDIANAEITVDCAPTAVQRDKRCP